MKALITGATKGIGLAIAEKYLENGHKVIGTGRSIDALDGLAKRYGEQFTGVEIDLLDKKLLDEFEKRLADEAVDVLINNAGINRISPVYETQGRDWDDIIFLNLTVPLLLTKAASKQMMKNRFGRIVNISSIYSTISRSERSSYSSSKAGLNGLTRACALDLAKYQVLVNAVSPGFTETELTKTILSKEEIEEHIEDIPLGRMAQPKDIAAVVFFLGSEMNTYITGQNLVIDGGYSIR